MIWEPKKGRRCYALVEYWGSYCVVEATIESVKMRSVDVVTETDNNCETMFRVERKDLFCDAKRASEVCAYRNGYRGR